MNELHLFAGAGGGILAGQLLGQRCVCAVEWEPYAQAVLVARQNDGCFPPFPIWDDVQTFDGRPWRGLVDIVAGGFPCQDISVAGGVEAWTAKDQECGSTLPASLARYDPDSHTLKTAQLSFLEDLTGCCLTLPRWGLMQDGECYQQPMWAPLTGASESGSMPTPLKDDWKGGTTAIHSTTGKPRTDQFRHWIKIIHGLTYPIPEHSEAVMGWPIGMTDLKPLATARFQEWQQQHSIY